MRIDKNLDQFYTNPKVSDRIVNIFFSLFPSYVKYKFLEPSAGTGNFIKSLIKFGVKSSDILAYDIEPKDPKIQKANYLKLNIKEDNLIVIGNPPFGKRGKLAIDFLNKSLSEANIVCMILPNIFNRYSVQKQIDKKAKLIYSENLDDKSFTYNDKEYSVRCTLQIWVKIPTYSKNIRIINQPKRVHPDFTTYIHNNTKETLKYFDKSKYKWDFAVVRQGYYNYNEKITDETKLIKNRQYFFVKANNLNAMEIINKIDFEKLSMSNTQVYGFSTTDFVREYMILNGEIIS